jgi:hypothetical protein
MAQNEKSEEREINNSCKLMDFSVIRENYPLISAAANDVLGLFGPEFTGRPEAHVETDISAAASLAGLMILRSKGFDLAQFKTGTVILSELDSEMNEIWNFMTAAAANMGLDSSGGWEMIVPKANKPLYGVAEMTHKTEKEFLAICGRHNIKKEFYPYVAVLAALKLVYAANKMNVLDQSIGKALTGYHVVAGAKTVPYPLEKE